MTVVIKCDVCGSTDDTRQYYGLRNRTHGGADVRIDICSDCLPLSAFERLEKARREFEESTPGFLQQRDVPVGFEPEAVVVGQYMGQEPDPDMETEEEVLLP